MTTQADSGERVRSHFSSSPRFRHCSEHPRTCTGPPRSRAARRRAATNRSSESMVRCHACVEPKVRTPASALHLSAHRLVCHHHSPSAHGWCNRTAVTDFTSERDRVPFTGEFGTEWERETEHVGAWLKLCCSAGTIVSYLNRSGARGIRYRVEGLNGSQLPWLPPDQHTLRRKVLVSCMLGPSGWRNCRLASNRGECDL
jgi:hypothetical protein